MSKQYHYVVVWDAEEGGFYIESEMTDHSFPDGEVWNKDTAEWESRHEIDEMNEAYLEIEDILAVVLSERNDMLNELTTEITEMNEMVKDMEETND